MDNRVNPLSVTPTVGKQTQTREFGDTLKQSLQAGVSALGTVSGLLQGAPGLGIVSAAVSSVTNFAAQNGNRVASVSRAATGVTQVGGTSAGVTTGTDMGLPADMNGLVSQMRAEADRSIAVQMQMQQESRDYNTLSNVIKTRHDSAKAAINNIR